MLFNSIGKKIKEKRLEKGYSQKQFAEMIGKSIRTLQKYESGEIETPLQILNKIADTLNAPMEEFINSNAGYPELKTLADLYATLFNLEQKENVNFEIKEVFSEEGNVSYSINFETYDMDSPLNQEISNFLMEYKYYLEQIAARAVPTEIFESWKEKTLISAQNTRFRNTPLKSITYNDTVQTYIEQMENGVK